jgi:hypothetical protein
METRRRTETDARLDGEPDYDYAAQPPPPRSSRVDLSALFVLLDAVRRAVPRDVERQFTALLREALLTLRSLIDWYLERIDRAPRDPKVEDIPID